MSTSLRFGLTAAIVIAVVALGYLLSKHQVNTSNVAASASGDYATNPDGTVDYSRKADGTPVPLTSRLLK